jgi:hypothetical protein
MSYLVIAVDNATAEDQNKISTYLGEIGGYWHWIQNFWLANTNGEETPTEVRDAIRLRVPAVTCIVIRAEVNERNTWAAQLPTQEVSKWSRWLHAYWKPGV